MFFWMFFLCFACFFGYFCLETRGKTVCFRETCSIAIGFIGLAICQLPPESNRTVSTTPFMMCSSHVGGKRPMLTTNGTSFGSLAAQQV